MTIGDRIRALLGRTIIFGVFGVASRVSGLVTLPLLTRSLGPEQYGILDYYLVVTNVVTVIAVLGLDSAAVRFFFDSNDERNRYHVLSQIFTFQLCLVVPLVVIGAIIYIAEPVGQSYGAGVLLLLALAQSALMTVIVHFQNIMIWREMKLHYVVSTAGQTILTVALLVWLAFRGGMTVTEALTVFLVARAATAVHGLFMCRAEFGLTRQFTQIRAMLSFAWPIALVGTFGAVAPFIERQSVVSLMSEAHLGIYASASRITMLVLVPIAAFQIVWVPFALSHFREESAEEIYRLILKLFTLFGLVATLVLSAAAGPILKLLAGEQFIDGRLVVFPLCFGLVLKAMGDMIQVGIDISRKTYFKLVPFTAMIILSLVLVPLLTYEFGLLGAAWGAFAAFATKAIIEYIVAQSVHRIQWHGARLMLICVAACALGWLLYVAQLLATEEGAMLLGLVGAVSILASGWFWLLDADERDHVSSMAAGLTPFRRDRINRRL